MTTYGQFPGVKVQVSGGGITAIEVGSEEKVVFFGRGGSDANAPVNEPTQFQSRRGIETKFGSEDIDGNEPDLTRALKLALANGGNISFMFGVQYDTGGNSGVPDLGTDSPVESLTSVSEGTLSDAPIVENKSLTAVEDAANGDEVTVNFVYDEVVSEPDSGEINVNPHTGDFNAQSTSDYDFYYQYPLWEDALNAADRVVNEEETGLYVTLSEAESVAGLLSGKTTALRQEYQLVNGLTAAQPNITTDSGTAEYDAGNYTDTIDNDSQFLTAPVRLDGSTQTVLGAVGGLFGGAAISEPIYNDTINTAGNSLQQSLLRSEARELRDDQVIPIRQAGSVRVKGNLSTSTETDFTRDFFRRRIVDRTILIAKAIGDSIVGRINTPETRESAQRAIQTQLQSLANDQLIKDNVEDEQNFFVDVVESPTDSDEVLIDIGVTPVGIVKRVDETITINT